MNTSLLQCFPGGGSWAGKGYLRLALCSGGCWNPLGSLDLILSVDQTQKTSAFWWSELDSVPLSQRNEKVRDQTHLGYIWLGPGSMDLEKERERERDASEQLLEIFRSFKSLRPQLHVWVLCWDQKNETQSPRQTSAWCFKACLKVASWGGLGVWSGHHPLEVFWVHPAGRRCTKLD